MNRVRDGDRRGEREKGKKEEEKGMEGGKKKDEREKI